VPVGVLVELIEAVEERRATRGTRHPLASVLRERRVDAESLILGRIPDAPSGWEERLVAVRVLKRVGQEGDVTALCLEAHDLVLAQCVAGRERDCSVIERAAR
jgi:hypothetical protein